MLPPKITPNAATNKAGFAAVMSAAPDCPLGPIRSAIPSLCTHSLTPHCGSAIFDVFAKLHVTTENHQERGRK